MYLLIYDNIHVHENIKIYLEGEFVSLQKPHLFIFQLGIFTVLPILYCTITYWMIGMWLTVWVNRWQIKCG